MKKKYYIVFVKEENKGSIVVEAAIVLPIFLLLIISLMNFFVLINYQNEFQSRLISEGLKIGGLAYTIDRLNNLNEKEGIIDDKIDKNLLNSGITSTYISQKILTKEFQKYTEKSGITKEILFISSIGEEGDGVNDISANYKMKFNIAGMKELSLGNRCYFRSWVGESLKVNEEEKNIKKVYVTLNGKVYHKEKNCTYINIVTVKVKLEYIDNFRNESGGKYYECEYCSKKNYIKNEDVYISASGNRYHYSENCKKIDRDVIEIEISEVGNRKACSKCCK